VNHTNVIQINFTFVFYALSKRFVWIIHIPNNNICFISKLPRERKPVCDITEILLMKRGMKHHKTKPSHIPYLKENPSVIFHEWFSISMKFYWFCYVDKKLKMATTGPRKKTAANRKIFKMSSEKPPFCLNENHR
jgi:hypothetical protein